MTDLKLSLQFAFMFLMLSLAMGHAQAAANPSSVSRCVGHDNKGQAFVHVSCLYGGQVQQLCANGGARLLMAVLWHSYLLV